MAEYYAVLKKAVGGLEPGAAESRRSIYDKARNALIGQLKAIDPPLPAAEISRQRLELEEAIRRVERETVAAAQASRTARAIEQELTPAAVPPQPVPPAPPPAPSYGNQSSPQDVFRRAIRQAETRPQGPSQPAERVVGPPRPAAPSYGPPPVENARPVPPPEWSQPERPDFRAEPPRYTPPPPPSDPRMAPDYSPEPDWRAQQPSPSLAAEPYVDRLDRPPRKGKAERSKAFVDEDDNRFAETEEPRRSRWPTLILLFLILCMLGGLGALAWSQRAILSDLVAGLAGSEGTTASAPEETSAPPPVAAGKDADRLPGTQASDDQVRDVGDGVEPGTQSAAPDPIGEAISGAPQSDPQPQASTPQASAPPIAGGQKAVLYEEPLDPATAAAGVVAIDGTIGWRFVEGGSNGPEVEATLVVPERGLNVRLSLRRNTDQTLPASHLVETVFQTPANFPGRGIKGVPRLVLKTSEDERGQPLIGAAAQVADGFFWIALSAANNDITTNLSLLREREWFDLPIVYESGQRAILTFEKGEAGKQAFDRAFAAWGTG